MTTIWQIPQGSVIQDSFGTTFTFEEVHTVNQVNENLLPKEIYDTVRVSGTTLSGMPYGKSYAALGEANTHQGIYGEQYSWKVITLGEGPVFNRLASRANSPTASYYSPIANPLGVHLTPSAQ